MRRKEAVRQRMSKEVERKCLKSIEQVADIGKHHLTEVKYKSDVECGRVNWLTGQVRCKVYGTAKCKG